MNVKNILNEADIIALVKADPWMMKVLGAAREINLPDWMIGAGFIRNKVWSHLHGEPSVLGSTSDVDLIYFDHSNQSEDYEKLVEQKLRTQLDCGWSVKNMARMSKVNNDSPYLSTADGLAHWVETATCVAVKLNESFQIELIAPYGIDDLVNLVIRPSPAMSQRMGDFDRRIKKKDWLTKWPKLKVIRE